MGLYRFFKDKKRRKIYCKNELQFFFVKSLISTKLTSERYRNKLSTDTYNYLNNYGARTKIRNRCTYKDSSRSILSKFKLSRMCFRELVNKGRYPGLGKFI